MGKCPTKTELLEKVVELDRLLNPGNMQRENIAMTLDRYRADNQKWIGRSETDSAWAEEVRIDKNIPASKNKKAP